MTFERGAMIQRMVNFQKRMDDFNERLNDYHKIIDRHGDRDIEREEIHAEVIDRIEDQLDVILEKIRSFDCFVEKISIKLEMMNPDIDALD